MPLKYQKTLPKKRTNNTAEDEEKERFYEQLQGILDEIPVHDIKIFMGDFNAQIGADRSGREEVKGGMAKGERSVNGERLLDLCSSHRLKIGGSFFQHKDVPTLTWMPPDGMTHTHINHAFLEDGCHH